MNIKIDIPRLLLVVEFYIWRLPWIYKLLIKFYCQKQKELTTSQAKFKFYAINQSSSKILRL